MWTYLDLDGWAYWPSQSWHGPDRASPPRCSTGAASTTGQLRLEVER